MCNVTASNEPLKFALLTSNFPPVGGGGTPRIVQTIKYLKESSYSPTVFTIQPEKATYSREFQEDESHLSSLRNARYETIRISPRHNSCLKEYAERYALSKYAWALRYSKLYESERCWAMRANDAIVQRGRTTPFRFILASAPPYSVLEAASKGARRLQVPWVADMRDLWTQDTLKFYPTRWHYQWASRFEKRILESAAAILANTPLSGQRLREFLSPMAAERVFVLPNGYNEDDTPLAPLSYTAGTKTMEVVHAGTLYNPGTLGARLGRYRPHAVDNTARSFVPICKGLARLAQIAPETAKRVRMRFLGYVPHGGKEFCKELGLSSQVSFEGVVSREVALQAVRNADIHLVVQVAWEDSQRPMPYIPGKVYDALATGKPILAPVGPGDLRDLLTAMPSAFVCDYRDPQDIADALKRVLTQVKCESTLSSQSPALRQFNRKLLTKRMASVFDWVIDCRAPKPAADHWIGK